MSLVPCSPPSICDISVLFVSSVCSLSTLLWSRAVHENPRSKQTWKNCMMASPIPISFTYTHCHADKYNNLPIMPLLDRYASHSCWRNSIKRAWHARLVNDQRAFWLRRDVLPYQTWWMDDCNYPPSQVHPPSSIMARQQ